MISKCSGIRVRELNFDTTISMYMPITFTLPSMGSRRNGFYLTFVLLLVSIVALPATRTVLQSVRHINLFFENLDELFVSPFGTREVAFEFKPGSLRPSQKSRLHAKRATIHTFDW